MAKLMRGVAITIEQERKNAQGMNGQKKKVWFN